MTTPTPPKQYFITCDHSLVDTGRAPDDADGFFMFADEALAYANELAAAREKQARLDALEEAAVILDKYVVLTNERNGSRLLQSENKGDVLRTTYADAIRKLKEGV